MEGGSPAAGNLLRPPPLLLLLAGTLGGIPFNLDFPGSCFFLLFTCGNSRQVKESFQLLLLLFFWGNYFVRPLDALVAKSRTYNIGR